jgi:hypothetical protein
MACFYHPEQETFTFCSDCGREVCTDCAFGEDSTFFCTSCCEQGVLAEAFEAQKRLNGARIAAGVLGLFSAFMAVVTPADPSGAGILGKVVLIAATAYMGWCVYLVFPEVMAWWGRTFGEAAPSSYATTGPALLRSVFFTLAPLIASCYYGMLGGGIHTYLKMRRIARCEPLG